MRVAAVSSRVTFVVETIARRFCKSVSLNLKSVESSPSRVGSVVWSCSSDPRREQVSNDADPQARAMNSWVCKNHALCLAVGYGRASSIQLRASLDWTRGPTPRAYVSHLPRSPDPDTMYERSICPLGFL